MKRRYVWLLLACVLVAVGLSVWGGPAGRRAPTGGEASVPVPSVELVLMIGADGKMTPASASVEKGRRVGVTVTNTGPRSARLELPGYEDRIVAQIIMPGDTWRGEFLADRPGDDFAWTVNGEPAGKLVVTGSHLIEGHR